MANPIIINCPKDQWTKIATNVTFGNVLIDLVVSGNYLINYYYTYRLTGQAAPVDKLEGARLSDGADINSSEPIDVYIYPEIYDGRVRLDA